MALTKAEIAEALFDQLGLNKREARELVDMFFEELRAALAAGEQVSGCTVHYVDEKIDHGQIIAQREVRILPDDTPERLHARIQIAERELYPAVIAEFCGRYRTAAS